MNKTLKPFIVGASLLLSSAVFADTVAIPIGQQGAAHQNEARPRGGMSMSQVSSQYGSPAQQLPAVGDPPISRWVYSHFTVYFEHDRVIHTVLHSGE